VIFVTHDQPPKALKPADGAFDFVASAVAAKPSRVLRARFHAVVPMRTDQLNAAFQKSRSQGIAVSRGIVQKVFGQTMKPTLLKQWLHQRDFVRAGTGDLSAPRQSAGVAQKQDASTFAAPRFADAWSPLFAGQNVPSPMDSVVFRTPARSSRHNSRDQAFAQAPQPVQSRWRRQQVLGEGKCSGRSFQRAPVLSTQLTPSKQARDVAGGRPPFGDRLGSGNKSAISDHCSSVSSTVGSVLDPVEAPTASQSWDPGISDLLSTSLNTHERHRGLASKTKF
jgi:hypothetical protein